MNRRDAIAFVARSPFENAFLHWVLEGDHGNSLADDVILYRDRNGALTGAVYYGSQLVLAANDPAAVDAFAVETRRHPGMRSFVGPQSPIERLWTNVSSWHRPPALVRAYQPIYVLTAAGAAAATSVDVRRATLDDADRVIDNSAQMMLVELGYDPRVNRTSFSAGVRRAISLGHWWLWIAGDELRFQLNVGARTRVTAQLQGVWTPPALRKRGYAAMALGEIARRLLADNPTLSLYVNDFNLDAIALYERLGFVRAGAMSTLLFP